VYRVSLLARIDFLYTSLMLRVVVVMFRAGLAVWILWRAERCWYPCRGNSSSVGRHLHDQPGSCNRSRQLSGRRKLHGDILHRRLRFHGWTRELVSLLFYFYYMLRFCYQNNFVTNYLAIDRKQRRSYFSKTFYEIAPYKLSFSHHKAGLCFAVVQVGDLSRLECVKAAVIKQLKQLRDEHPTRKVALVTFDTEVWLVFHRRTYICSAYECSQCSRVYGAAVAESRTLSVTIDRLSEQATEGFLVAVVGHASRTNVIYSQKKLFTAAWEHWCQHGWTSERDSWQWIGTWAYSVWSVASFTVVTELSDSNELRVLKCSRWTVESLSYSMTK